MDKGFGHFGSSEWHINQIESMDDQESIINYVYQLRDLIIEPQPTLEEMKEKAIQSMRVH